MGIIGDYLDELERKERIKQYYSNGGTLISEDAYSVIPSDAIYIDSFYVDEYVSDDRNVKVVQQTLRNANESRFIDTFKKKRRFDVYVNANEGKNIRHFHIVAHDDSGDETCVQIEINKYFTHGNKTYIFNNKECKALNELMYKPHKIGKVQVTTYEYIIDAWNTNNKDMYECAYNEQNEPIIPNYSSITPYK